MYISISTLDRNSASGAALHFGDSAQRQTQRQPAEQKAHPYFRRNMRSHLAVASHPFDLTSAVVRAVTANGPAARARGVEIRLDLLAPLVVQGDARLLARCVSRLLGLVVEQAAARSTATCTVSLDDDHNAVIEIRAECMRHSRQALARRLAQADQCAAAERQTPGPGSLNPWLARLVIEEHRGRVRARAGSGSQAGLEITLPAAFL